jgi:hypothetical protein
MHIETEHHVEPRRIGQKWFDIGITISLLIVSISSLTVAYMHHLSLDDLVKANNDLVETNKRLVEANSWPFLYYDTSNGQMIRMSVTNDGVGPAKIEAIEVKWNGKPQRNADEFLAACCGFRPGTADVEYALIAGKVLRSGQTISVIGLQHTPADDGAWNRLNRMRINRAVSIDICYCSVFDQCWFADIARFSLTPREVDKCTTPAVPFTIPD